MVRQKRKLGRQPRISQGETRSKHLDKTAPNCMDVETWVKRIMGRGRLTMFANFQSMGGQEESRFGPPEVLNVVYGRRIKEGAPSCRTEKGKNGKRAKPRDQLGPLERMGKRIHPSLKGSPQKLKGGMKKKTKGEEKKGDISLRRALREIIQKGGGSWQVGGT